MKKIIISLVTCFSLFALVVIPIHAQTIDTIIKGTVRDSEGNTIGNVPVEINCDGNIKSTTANGFGDYLVTYAASQCSEGDTAFAEADTPYGTGYASGIIERFTSGASGLVLDIGLVNIAVPEFGMVTGVMAAVGSAGTYWMLRRRKI